MENARQSAHHLQNHLWDRLNDTDDVVACRERVLKTVINLESEGKGNSAEMNESRGGRNNAATVRHRTQLCCWKSEVKGGYRNCSASQAALMQSAKAP